MAHKVSLAPQICHQQSHLLGRPGLDEEHSTWAQEAGLETVPCTG